MTPPRTSRRTAADFPRRNDIDVPPLLPRAYYSASVEEFLAALPLLVLGSLTANAEFDVDQSQKLAWERQIEILRRSLRAASGHLFLEFTIPRMGRRVDALLLLDWGALLIEFKVGETRHSKAAESQAWDYAIDLRNFHESSHDLTIVPVVVSTDAPRFPGTRLQGLREGVHAPLFTNAEGLEEVLRTCATELPDRPRDVATWVRGSYRPTPTIIEAAQALYSRHEVEEIARSDAGARNLAITARRIDELADRARDEARKIICIVTGVPGAGKTLVGLNTATRRSDRKDPTHAVFLSGNGPLVAVLREALTRDEYERQKTAGSRPRKGEIGESVKAFIQNVHHFRDEGLRSDRPPADHVVIFDEAQRAWDLAKTAQFMKTKKKLADFRQSEPEFLLRYLDRHPDWAFVVCLVGQGQEINDGEAGMSEWLAALEAGPLRNWDVVVSPEFEAEAGGRRAAARVAEGGRLRVDPALHLGVSMRSFRAENVSAFVHAVLDVDQNGAKARLSEFHERYPVVISRDLAAAKAWVRERARGSERYGLLASSEAQRLKPEAVDVRAKIDPVHWFLNDRQDTRSSWYLEDAATQFQVQGLELDWACVTWDADLQFDGADWKFHTFHGSRWKTVRQQRKRQYLKNAYRVLLTRARQGMVVFIPKGDRSDHTRLPEFYDGTFEFLAGLGIPVVA